MKLELRVLPWTLLSLYTLKLLILGTQFVDAPVIFTLALFLAILEYKAKDSQYEELKNNFKQLEDHNKTLEKKLDEVKSHVSSIKIAQTTGMFGRK